MARGKGKGKGKGKVKGRATKKSKGNGLQIRQSKLSRWLGRSTSPEFAPDPDDPDERNLRKNLRWLHAGIYKDAQAELQDIWYAFKHLRNGSYRLVYASDSFGSSHGNFNVGQIKRNMVTFDEHHRRKWRHFLNPKGNWVYKSAKRGRRCQRQTLLDTFLDLNFVDPYPRGKDNKVIGPPLNVIHYINDKTKSAVGRGRGGSGSASATPPFTPPEQCYPHTNIPLSTERIKVGVFKESHKDPTKLISNFLTGNLKYYPTGHVHRKQQLDHIESAFYDQGWRVDRAAVDQALDDMQELGQNAFDSNAFTQNLPIRVDRHKGEEVEKLMVKVGGKEPTEGSDSDNDSEEDSDSENDMFVGRSPKPKGSGGATRFGPKFQQDLARMMAGRMNGSSARNSEQDDSDGFEFLPDDSPLKGKAPASKKHAREEVTEPTEVQNEIQENNDHVEVVEDRSTPAKRIKSEPPMFQSNQNDPIIIEEALFQDDSDIEFIEERNVRTK